MSDRSPSLVDEIPLPVVADQTDFLRLLAIKDDEIRKLTAERDKEQGSREYDAARARLLEPYAHRIYWFLVGYCGTILGLLLLQGFRFWNFDLPESVLLVISGSTAVSAIGLVGFVVSGLFRGRLLPLPEENRR